MDKTIERKITEYRKEGYGYKKIASLLDISKNTIATFCKRNNLGAGSTSDVKYCKYCGTAYLIDRDHKNKIFCSMACRNKWWNEHRLEVYKDRLVAKTCPVCDKEFSSYRSTRRKYCSHACYIKARCFKRGDGHD